MNIPKIYRSGFYQIIHYDEINSTNDHAWNLISNSNPNDNVVIVADYQSKGKGQYGRKWEATKGENITMTAIVSPHSLHIKNAFHLNIIVSLAICKVIENHIKEKLHVKWPNDIYYNNSKLCGILIKNKVVNNYVKHSIIGMGINLNQRTFSSEAPNPTSLALISDQPFDKKKIINEILSSLYYHFEKVKKDDISSSCIDYNDRLYRKYEAATFKVNGEQKELNIQKVSDNGLIYLKETDGIILELSSGLEYIL